MSYCREEQLTSQFLISASSSLATVNPGLSRDMLRHLVEDVQQQLDLSQSLPRTTVCGSCFSTFSPGHTCTVRLSRSRRDRNGGRRSPRLVITCGVCEVITRVDLPEKQKGSSGGGGGGTPGGSKSVERQRQKLRALLEKTPEKDGADLLGLFLR